MSERCQECGKPIASNDLVAYIAGKVRRYWHQECFERSLTPIHTWTATKPKEVKSNGR